MPRSGKKKGGGRRRAIAGRVYVGEPPLPPRGGRGLQGSLFTSDDLMDLLRGKSLEEQEFVIQDFLSRQVAPVDRGFMSDRFIILQFEAAPYFGTYCEAQGALDRQEYRRGAELCWDAYEAATSQSLWGPGRIEAFACYVRVPGQHPHVVSKKDYQRLKAVFYDPAELAVLRLTASIYLMLLPDCRHLSREEKMEVQRVSLLIEASPDELSRKIAYADGDGPSVKVVRDLFQFARQCVAQDHAQNQHGMQLSSQRGFQSMEVVPEWEDARLFRRTCVGGSRCDFCQKTVQELGVTRLNCCGRCKATYYCGTNCQTAAWKDGHKQACRPPNSRVVGDLMRIHGLKNRTDLNGRLVRLVAPNTDDDDDGTTIVLSDQWQVSLYAEREAGDDTTKILLVKAKNLTHIRPAK